jgi:hypothetical protein
VLVSPCMVPVLVSLLSCCVQVSSKMGVERQRECMGDCLVSSRKITIPEGLYHTGHLSAVQQYLHPATLSTSTHLQHHFQTAPLQFSLSLSLLLTLRPRRLILILIIIIIIIILEVYSPSSAGLVCLLRLAMFSLRLLLRGLACLFFKRHSK